MAPRRPSWAKASDGRFRGMRLCSVPDFAPPGREPRAGRSMGGERAADRPCCPQRRRGPARGCSIAELGRARGAAPTSIDQLCWSMTRAGLPPGFVAAGDAAPTHPSRSARQVARAPPRASRAPVVLNVLTADARDRGGGRHKRSPGRVSSTPRGPVAQRQSEGLLIPASWVRIPAGSPRFTHESAP